MSADFNELNKLTIEVVDYKLKDVLLNALYETVGMFSGDEMLEEPENYVMPESIAKLLKELKDFVCQLPEQLKSSDRADFINSLAQCRDRLIKAYYGQNLYLYRIGQINCMYDKQCKLESIDFETENIDFNKFLDYLHQVIHELNNLDETEEASYMQGELISKFPLRMAKAKYSDYIKAGLTTMLTGLNGGFIENTVKLFKAKINPLVMPEYDHNNSYAEELKRLSEIEGLSFGDLTENLLDIEEISEHIEYSMDLCSIMYNSLIYITVLCQYCVDGEELLENNFEIKDMLYAAVEIFKGENSQIDGDSLVEKIEDLIDNLYEENREKEKKLNDTLDNIKEDDQVPEDTIVAVNVYTALKRTFVVEIIDELSGVTNDSGSNITVEEAVNEIVEFVQTGLDNFTVPQQKLIKQQLLGDMPSPFSADECYEYMAYAFEGVSDSKLKTFYMGEILDLTDPGDDEHHHDHDCDCGHDHHDHDCDCGHDHHHDHDCDCGHHH